MRKHFITKFLIIVTSVLTFTGCTANNTAAQPSEINVKQLYDKYSEQPDKNTPVYDGKEETATGVIVYIGKDDHGTDSMELAETTDGKPYVLGVFGAMEEMASVSVGDTVTIRGKYHIVSSHNMVVLKQCEIVEKQNA